jgi:DNA-binding NarL/FixJ family response regulator
MVLVSVMPNEVDQILDSGSALPTLSSEEEDIARRAAAGMSAEGIARDLHMTSRSVYRRLARLREKVGAKNSAELAARLSKLGF